MPKKTAAAHQSELMEYATELLIISSLIEDDYNDQTWPPSTLLEEDDNSIGNDGGEGEFEMEIVRMLEVEAWLAIERASLLSGPDSRGKYNQFPKCPEFFEASLQATDRFFRRQFRIGRNTFDRLVGVLACNPIFISKGRKPQRHVKYQLACFLMRYGAHGSNVTETAIKMAVGHGTVVLYCRRVCRAIRELRSQYVGWPTEERQQVISQAIEERSGFKKCLGSGDGSLIRFEARPEEDREAFQGRDKFIGTNIQATVDDRTRFTSYELGWPAAVPDAKVFKESHLWQHRNQYLKDGHYLLMDKGYPSTPYTVRPFNEPEIAKASVVDKERMRDFNRCLSSVRISVEHAFGRLKGRFPSLRMMGHHHQVQELYRVIEALIILHNFCIEHDDRPEDIIDFTLADETDDDSDSDEDEENEDFGCQDVGTESTIPAHETDRWLREEGHKKRLKLLDELFPYA